MPAQRGLTVPLHVTIKVRLHFDLSALHARDLTSPYKRLPYSILPCKIHAESKNQVEGVVLCLYLLE